MPFSLRNLKIRNQVLFLTLPLLLVLLWVVGLLFYNYWEINQINLSTEKSEIAALRARSLLEGLREMDISVRGYASTRREVFLRGYGSAAQSVSQDLDNLRNLNAHASSTGANLGTIRKDIEAWESQCANPAIERVKTGHSAEDVVAILNGCEMFGTIEKGITRFREASQNAAAASRTNRQRAIHRALMSGVVLAVLFGVLLLLLVHLVSHSISDSVYQLIRASERLRDGDFQPTLPPETQNEFGVLSRSFLHMADALRQDREELGAIKRFSEAVTECTSESEVYDHILHALRDRFHPNQVIIFKLRPEEDLLEAVSSLNPLTETVREWPVIEGKHSCKAVRMGRSFRMNDVSVEPPCPSKFALPTEGSYYCAPLIAGGIIIGAVRLEGESGFWTPERESLLESYLSTSASVLSTLQLLQTMREQANIDPLTGLYNRRFCKDYARKLMAMARRKDTPLGFIMLDLDHFKEINDMYGHEVGDRILKQFARTVTQSMRETNLTARLGGEEFVVLLPDTGASACQVVAERIRRAVAHMNMPQIKGKSLPQITVSLGIAVYPEHGGTLEEMLQSSDRALYESKRAGRNRATLYVEETETTG